MIPQQVLSSIAFPAPLILPNPEPAPLISRELGGIAISDGSQGLDNKVWTCTVIKRDAPLLDSIQVGASDVDPVTFVNAASVTQVSLAFDQNMRPVIGS